MVGHSLNELFQKYDSNPNKYNIITSGGTFTLYQGGASVMEVERTPKKRAFTQLEEISKKIKKNKQKQVMILYDVLYEQLPVSVTEDLNEELSTEVILKQQEELNNELTELEKERKRIINELNNDKKTKNMRRDVIRQNIDIHQVKIKDEESNQAEKQESYREISSFYDELLELNNKNLVEISNPANKIKIRDNKPTVQSSENNENENANANENSDEDSVNIEEDVVELI